MIENTRLLIATIALYMCVCLTLGFVAWKRTNNLGDYILGGRRLGSWVTAFSAQASDMSGWLLMGLPGLAYASGFDSVWLLGGLVVGTWLNWRFVAAPLRTRTEQLDNALTFPDYFERRFEDRSRVLRTLSAFFILIFFTFYASSQFVASGRLFELLFNVPHAKAMLWGSAVMLTYTFFGGFLAVSWSDMLQGTLMFFALIIVALMGVHLAGGPGPAIHALNARDPLLLDPFIGNGSQAIGAIGIASLVGWGLGYAGQPHVLARFMAVKSADQIPTSRRVAMVWVVSVLAAAVVVGMTGLLVLEQPLTGPDTEKVFILMSVEFLPPVIAGVCLAGILAAVMSTVSAQLLVASSAFAQDFYKGLWRPDAGGRELLWVGRFTVLAIAAIAFVIALDPNSKVLTLVEWAWAGFGAAFGPAIILSLYWPRMTRNGALAGILVGGLTVIGWDYVEHHGGPAVFQLYELVPGFVFSWLSIWLVSRAGGARAPA